MIGRFFYFIETEWYTLKSGKMQREGVVHKMEMRDLALPSLNRFASDYLQGQLEVEDYFHYDLASKDMYRNRYRRTYEPDILCVKSWRII